MQWDMHLVNYDNASTQLMTFWNCDYKLTATVHIHGTYIASILQWINKSKSKQHMILKQSCLRVGYLLKNPSNACLSVLSKLAYVLLNVYILKALVWVVLLLLGHPFTSILLVEDLWSCGRDKGWDLSVEPSLNYLSLCVER